MFKWVKKEEVELMDFLRDLPVKIKVAELEYDRIQQDLHNIRSEFEDLKIEFLKIKNAK